MARSNETKRVWFDPPTNLTHTIGKARGVLIDTEPKVISKVIEQTCVRGIDQKEIATFS